VVPRTQTRPAGVGWQAAAATALCHGSTSGSGSIPMQPSASLAAWAMSVQPLRCSTSIPPLHKASEQMRAEPERCRCGANEPTAKRRQPPGSRISRANRLRYTGVR
jgi:hypothetical protein